MRYIQSNPIFYGFTISFHHSKEVFVCCLIVSLRCVFWVGLSIRGGGIDSPRPASQRAAALVLTAALLTGAAFPAFAGTYYIEDGDIVISAGTDTGTNKVAQTGKETVNNDKDTVITNREKNASSNTVTIEAKDKDDKVEVTLKDVNIDTSKQGKAAVSVTGSGDTTIELDGDNKLSGSGAHAALEHNQTVDSERNVTSGKLTIQDDNDKAGSLTATGGIQNGAGIGAGGYGVSSGKIEITGGDITAVGGKSAAGIGGSGYRGNADITISGGTIRATGGDQAAGIGGGTSGNGKVTITGDAVIEESIGGSSGAGAGNATGGAGIGGGANGHGTIDISGNAQVKNALGKDGGAGIGGGYGAKNDKDGNGNQITIKSNESGAPTVNATGGESSIDKKTKKKIPGGAGIGSGFGDAKANITLEGKVTIAAKAGEGNAAIGDMNGEQEFTGLAEGSSIIRYDSEGNNITLPTDPGYPVPADTSSSGGGSAGASVQESVFPGLVVTDKDGQRISYTSIRGNNVLSLSVGRFTASLHASLAALRQLRAEGIDTITFQTILCSTTLSVDELLAMGGEDAEVVLTHHIRSSTLTVGGKAV